MNCELAQTTVHGYFDGELDAMRSEEFERHLANCAQCQAELRDMSLYAGSVRKATFSSKLRHNSATEFANRLRGRRMQNARNLSVQEGCFSFRPSALRSQLPLRLW